jgi:hypothetical protein
VVKRHQHLFIRQVGLVMNGNWIPTFLMFAGGGSTNRAALAGRRLMVHNLVEGRGYQYKIKPDCYCEAYRG